MSTLNKLRTVTVPSHIAEQKHPSTLDDAEEDIKLAIDLTYFF